MLEKGVERMTYLIPGKIYFISFLRKALFNNFLVIVHIVLKFSPRTTSVETLKLKFSLELQYLTVLEP